jgi:sugar phosphate isomerase/epimerase
MSITMAAIAVASMFFHEYTCPEIFSFVSASGLTGMEFWLETPHFWLRDCPIDDVRVCKNTHPEILSFNVHAPILDLNPCSINPKVASVSVEYTVRSIGIAEKMGAEVLTVHPGRRTAKRPPSTADFERFDRYITALCDAAKKTEIKISMENMEPLVNSLLCTPTRMRKLLDEEPWLYFTLDISHALAGNPEDVFKYIDLCSHRLINVHVSRIEGKRPHFPLNNNPDIEPVLQALRDCGYSGSLTLEIEDLNLQGPLTSQEKVSLLASERAFLKQFFE